MFQPSEFAGMIARMTPYQNPAGDAEETMNRLISESRIIVGDAGRQEPKTTEEV